MNLITLLRLLGLIVIGWMTVALGAGAFGLSAREVSGSTTFFIPSRSLHDAVPSGRPDGPDKMKYHLLDRATGKIEALPLPLEPAWSLLSVSPWRDQDGDLRAVGRWVSRLEENEEFCGLALLRLPDMTVINRITLDVLPTGKPCWVPGRSDEVIFPAGDGQLYRCNVGDRTGDSSVDASTSSGGSEWEDIVPVRPVAWKAKQPASGVIYLGDPAWSSEPSVRHLVFVALSMMDQHENQRIILPSRVWWLLVNEDGDAIVAAGSLTDCESAEPRNNLEFERMPNVVIGPGGKISLVYLARKSSENSWRLRSARIELDPATSLPRIERNAGASHVVAEGLSPGSLVVSADGERVYAIDASGQTVVHALPR
jgi:hypothetical protein